MKRHLLTTFVGFLVGVTSSLAGELTFEKKLIEVDAGLDQDTVTVDFTFKSTGTDAAVIKRYDAPCSCLEAQISDGGRLTWAAGEEGTVRGIFKVGNFRGTIAKQIAVLMKDGVRHELVVRMTTPELLKIEPKTLKWPEGGESEKQCFDITVSEKFPVKIVGVTGTNEKKFPFELEKVEEGKSYKIWVTPSEVKTRGFGLLRIETDSKFKKHKNYQAYVVVSKGKAGP